MIKEAKIMTWLREQGKDIIIDVQVLPRAHDTKVVGIHNDRLKIKVAAVPDKGKANMALIKFLAVELNIPTYQIEIMAGHTSKKKTLKITGITKDVAEKLVE